MHRRSLLFRCSFITLLLPALAGCSSEETPLSPATCNPLPQGFEQGSATGHADPFGAKSAGQARASRIADAVSFPQPAHGRQRIQTGDFVLVNDKISVVIEDMGPSDGYATFGGEIIAVDQVGDDGRPMGVSRYLESFIGIGIELINPTSISVLHDGSDGGAAVVRVAGTFEVIPFLDGGLGAIFPDRYGLTAAQDYILEPGAESLSIQLHLLNLGPDPIDFGVNRSDSSEVYGFFHYSQNQLVTPEFGYAEPEGNVSWVGYDGGPFAFALRTPRSLEYGLTISGFTLFWGEGFLADKCSVTTIDQAEIIAGGPGYDGLRETIRRVDAEPPWRKASGTLSDATGQPVADGWVHALDTNNLYLTRTKTAADGSFSLHIPTDQDVTLVAQKRGYPTDSGTNIPAGSNEPTVAFAFAAHAMLHVVVTEEGTNTPLPVRVQVIPTQPVAPTPASYGELDEVGSRLYQEFAVTGDATLVVPPGEHRVIVSRGYEWELFDTKVTANPGETVEIAAPLFHSVDTTGVMCADFHIHSYFSADSNDPVEHKVKGAIADGLDIPVSSEHEWITDFQPIIEQLGLTQWAFGVASEELTTFTWGHMGVVPLKPDYSKPNAGAVDWIGKQPSEVFDTVQSRPEDPVLIINHPSGSSFGGYFRAASYDRKTGAGSQELWSSNFDAVEVYNSSDFEENRGNSVADWFSLLNHGVKVWSVGSSDSHHLRTSPVGYPRTCIYFGHDDTTSLTPDAVRGAVMSGSSTISGGLYMTVLGPNGERPGDTVTAPGGTATFTIMVEAPSWISADTLETIVNGETVATEPLLPLGPGPSQKFANQVQVTLDPGKPQNWVVFHAKGEGDLAPLHPGKHPFAASNPVFLK